jgi:hypothetical protein
MLAHLLCTFPNLEAYDPVINEWKMMMVSSRSQMKTRSKFDSGSGDGLGALRFLFRALLDPPVKRHTKLIKDHVHYLIANCVCFTFARSTCLDLTNDDTLFVCKWESRQRFPLPPCQCTDEEPCSFQRDVSTRRSNPIWRE